MRMSGTTRTSSRRQISVVTNVLRHETVDHLHGFEVAFHHHLNDFLFNKMNKISFTIDPSFCSVC